MHCLLIMHPVFISPSMKQKQINKINKIISKYKGFLVEDQAQAQFIIKNEITYLDSQSAPIKISAKCLFMMDNELIDPFTYKYSTNCLNNIYLKNKTFSFHNCNTLHVQQCTNLIEMMDGQIVDEFPNYYLVENEEASPFTNSVSIEWIYALQHSSLYISPSSYAHQTHKYDNKTDDRTSFQTNTEPQVTKFNYDSSFILEAKKTQKKYKYNFTNLKKELERSYKDLKSENLDTFTNELQLGFSKMKSQNNSENPHSFFEDYQTETAEKNRKPFKKKSALLESIFCGTSKHEGRWADCEKRQLIYVLKEGACTNSIFTEKGGIDWMLVASKIPGRSIRSCVDKYNLLLERDEIECIEKQTDDVITSDQFNKMLHKAFYPEQEERLYRKIIEKIDADELVTTKDISMMAIDEFYSPLNLALKSVVISYINKEQWPFDKYGNINIPQLEEEVNKIIAIAEESPDDLIEKYKIKNFTASPSWTYKFIKRHNLSFRAAHYERRGAINPEEVEHFLSTLADILVRYDPKFIFNMDETFINVFNNPIKAIVRKGQSTVSIIKDKLDKKEGTTYISTISMDASARLPLFIIARGGTHVCERKFKLDRDNDEISHTKNGWTTADLMVEYLQFLSNQVDGQPCALLLDSYKAHMHDKVRQEAQRLHIELLYIPSCGTSLYQPLDRFVFGVLKKKLRASKIEITESNFKERYKLIHQAVSDIWNSLKDDLITKAWEIPGLIKFVYNDGDDKRDKDYQCDIEYE